MDVARWPRPVSNLRSVRSERVSSFALKSWYCGENSTEASSIDRHSPPSQTNVCVRERDGGDGAAAAAASVSLPGSLPPSPTKLPVWLSCAAPPPARWAAGLFLSSSAPKSAREYRSHGGFGRTSLPPPACAPIYNLLSSVLRNSNMGCQTFCGVNEFTGKSEICARSTCSVSEVNYASK